MTEFVAGRGTTALGIIGTVLGSLGVAGNGVGGLFNGGSNACARDGVAVNRYEAEMQAKIANLETEVKLRDANTFTMGEMNNLRNYVDARVGAVEKELCDQRVYNERNNASVGCIANQVAQLMALTKVVIPNSSLCPGYGDVTVSITPAPTT